MPNKFYHIVGVVQSMSLRRIYINGILEGTSSDAVTLDGSITDRFSIGVFDRATPAAFLNGNVASVAYFNRALNINEIYARYIDLISGHFSTLNYINRRTYFLPVTDDSTNLINTSFNIFKPFIHKSRRISA